MEHEGRSLAWGPWAIVSGDGYAGQGVADTGDDYDPAPDLDHTNEDVKGSLTDWLSWLHTEIGYDGWRLDYVKARMPSYLLSIACCCVCAAQPDLTTRVYAHELRACAHLDESALVNCMSFSQFHRSTRVMPQRDAG